MIVLDNISKSFGKAQVLNNISLTVNDCSIYGLIGYNGAGKTTLLNIVSGLYKADSGNISIDINGKGQNPFDNSQIKRSLFYVTDDPFYYFNANLITMRNFYCGFYPNWSDKSFQKLIELLNLDPNKKISDFSKGMKRQAAMILGLSSRPKYLLLDESFDGLDPNARTIVSNVLAEYIAETESTVIAASHNLYELENICDTVGMLNGTNLLYSDEIETIKKKVRKYRVAMNSQIADLENDIDVKFFKAQGNICTFQSGEDEEKIKEYFKNQGELLVFESFGMTLNEIFVYETEGRENEIEGIFAK